MSRHQVFAVLLIIGLIGMIILVIGAVTPNAVASVIGALFTGISFIMSLIQFFYQTPIIFGSVSTAPPPVPLRLPSLYGPQKVIGETLLYVCYIAPFAIIGLMFNHIIDWMILGIILSFLSYRFVLRIQSTSNSSKPSEMRSILGFLRFVVAIAPVVFLFFMLVFPVSFIIYLIFFLFGVSIDIYFSRKMFP